MLNVLCVTAGYETQQRHVSTESMQEFWCTLSVEGDVGWVDVCGLFFARGGRGLEKEIAGFSQGRQLHSKT